MQAKLIYTVTNTNLQCMHATIIHTVTQHLQCIETVIIHTVTKQCIQDIQT
jgi:hypothetical protein